MSTDTLSYKISNELPPVYDECVKRWGVSFDNTVFTYGDTIHAKYEPKDDLLAHELVHVKQQTTMGKDKWWEQYFADDKFRLDQEVEAYREQYKHYRGLYNNREWVAKALRRYAEALSGDMYGRIITFGEAIKLITR